MRIAACDMIECRDLVQAKKITFEEAREARKLLNMPGGLELHIGVSCILLLALPSIYSESSLIA